MKILVTGAGGFVGRHLLPVLAARFAAAEVVAPGGGFDVADAAAVEALVADVVPDACLHLAAIAFVGDARADPDRAWRVNLQGTLTLARAVLRHAPGCRFVYASSADIYGGSFKAGRPLDETAVPAPINVYGATKAAADLALGAMVGDGLRVVRVRPFNHTGPGQQANLVVPAFARQVMRIAAGLQPAVMQTGDLTPLRDFLDVRDVCAAYAACLDPAVDIAAGAIFNIASGRPVRIGDMLADLLRLAGTEARIETAGSLLRPSDIPYAAGDAGAALRVLGWRPAIDWQTTLADVVRDWRGRVALEA